MQLQYRYHEICDRKLNSFSTNFVYLLYNLVILRKSELKCFFFSGNIHYISYTALSNGYMVQNNCVQANYVLSLYASAIKLTIRGVTGSM